ncbi:gonadotropin releasing hormone receptor 3 isoform X2 [Gambusia affinis]|uniref:gonadotropin releasing hormone receptor 3 isoform X2 n=1 Tax=Gambusia affinis TaxID=33528 RepID=UPI001CDD18A2|nr:gonadotropin releasing hormone receptor 3 isoform X2 [Gambusia affinis]
MLSLSVSNPEADPESVREVGDCYAVTRLPRRHGELRAAAAKNSIRLLKADLIVETEAPLLRLIWMHLGRTGDRSPPDYPAGDEWILDLLHLQNQAVVKVLLPSSSSSSSPDFSSEDVRKRVISGSTHQCVTATSSQRLPVSSPHRLGASQFHASCSVPGRRHLSALPVRRLQQPGAAGQRVVRPRPPAVVSPAAFDAEPGGGGPDDDVCGDASGCGVEHHSAVVRRRGALQAALLPETVRHARRRFYPGRHQLGPPLRHPAPSGRPERTPQEPLYAAAGLESEPAAGFPTGESPLRRSGTDLIPKARMKTLKMTVVIVLSFVVCWTPYYLLGIWYWFQPDMLRVTPEYVHHALFVFGNLNTCCDPVIYGFYTPSFRADLAAFCRRTRSHTKPRSPSVRPGPHSGEDKAQPGPAHQGNQAAPR